MYWIDVYALLLVLRKNSPLYSLILVCTFIDFEKKSPPAHLFHPMWMALFWPARLLILRKKIPPARPYFALHVYWFWEKIPPARLFHPMWTALFWSARLMFSKNFPTCTFIWPYTFIWYTRVDLLIGTGLRTLMDDVHLIQTFEDFYCFRIYTSI